MDFTPFDILTAAELDDLVENDQALAAGTGLDNAAITYAKLLTTIFSGQVNTAANAGTAGGTQYWVNLGGIKILWGIGASQATGTGGTNFTVTLPASFFTTIQYNSFNPRVVGVSNHQWATGIGANTTTITFSAGSATNGSTQTTSWLVIGT